MIECHRRINEYRKMHGCNVCIWAAKLHYPIYAVLEENRLMAWLFWLVFCVKFAWNMVGLGSAILKIYPCFSNKRGAVWSHFRCCWNFFLREVLEFFVVTCCAIWFVFCLFRVLEISCFDWNKSGSYVSDLLCILMPFSVN